MKRGVSAALLAGGIAVSGSALAQVVTVGFGTGAVGVPLSPWAAAAAAVMLAVSAILIMKGKHRQGGFFALALAMLGGGLALNTDDALATFVGLTITGTNPTVSSDFGFHCSGIHSIPVRNSMAGNIILTSIQVTPSQWVIQSFVAGDCQIGGTLAPSASCNVRIDDSATCAPG